MKIEVSKGEIVDKFTILVIKKKNIKDSAKLDLLEKELNHLKPSYLLIWQELKSEELTAQLFEVNSKLWDVEDKLRELEHARDFGDTFIENARSVYTLNDERARIKRKINELTQSALTEVKSYE